MSDRDPREPRESREEREERIARILRETRARGERDPESIGAHASGGAPAPTSGGAPAPPRYLPGYTPRDERESFAAHFYRADPTDERDILPSTDDRLRGTLAAVRAPASIADHAGRLYWRDVARVEVPILSDYREYLHEDEEGDELDETLYDTPDHTVPRAGGDHRCPICLRPRVEDHAHFVYMSPTDDTTEGEHEYSRLVNLNSHEDMSAFINEVPDITTPTYGIEDPSDMSPDVQLAMHYTQDERHRRLMALHDAREYIQMVHRVGWDYSQDWNQEAVSDYFNRHTTPEQLQNTQAIRHPMGSYISRWSLLGSRERSGDLPRSLPPDYSVEDPVTEDEDEDDDVGYVDRNPFGPPDPGPNPFSGGGGGAAAASGL